MQTPLGQDGIDSAATPSVTRRLFALLSIAAILMLFFALVGIVFCRSWLWASAAPTSLLVVEGSAQFEGTRIRVDGGALASPMEGAITEAGGYLCRFPLPAGNYRVLVEIDGRTVYQASPLRMAEHQYALLSLPKLEQQRRVFQSSRRD